MTEPDPVPTSQPAFPPLVRGIELVAVAVSVVLCDVTLFRGEGCFGLAALFLALPVLLAIGSPIRRVNLSLAVMGLLLLGVVARLAWCGSPGAVVAGFACLIGFAMSLAGLPPYVTRGLSFASPWKN